MSTSTSSVETPSNEGGHSLLIDAAVGAVVTLALFFLPVVGTVVGGAVAGYLHRRDGLTVGAAAGFIAAIPLVAFVVLGLGLFTIVPDGSSAVGLSLGFVLVAIVSLLIAGAINAGLGALGGYVGVALRDDR